LIRIVDYGLGNVKAFLNCFDLLGIPAAAACSSDELRQSTSLILPGVGSFDYAMERINSSGLRETLDELVTKKKKPILGVCVGFQVMAYSSDEGHSKGLGWLNGFVKKLPANQDLPLPHMGWNTIHNNKEKCLLFKDLINPRFYFLHSYHFVTDDKKLVLAQSNYSKNFIASAGYDLIYGCQFHPEKSHIDGLKLLSNFSKI
tara:strand:+ start:2088 stop:2693 length:606 start_codon:yes stop_codon:yes gene_type:complete